MNRQQWMDQVALRGLCHRATLDATFELCRSAIAQETLGEFVECGVFAGSNAAAMARASVEAPFKQARRIHLFDSFMGIPKAGRKDEEFRAAGHKAGLSSCARADVESHMVEWGIPAELLVYHEGLFRDTVPKASFPNGIAVLRLDGDLYESTKVCMEHLWPKLNVGGWCIVDDFALSGARRAVLEKVCPSPVYFQRLD